MGQLGSVYKQPETGEDGPDTAGGCQVSRRGHKGELAKGGKTRGNAPCIYVNVLYVQRNEWKLNDTSYHVYNNNNQNECC